MIHAVFSCKILRVMVELRFFDIGYETYDMIMMINSTILVAVVGCRYINVAKQFIHGHD